MPPPPRCLVPSCSATSSNQWGLSPDGPRTLCSRCYSRYYHHRLTLYEDIYTQKLTVIPSPTARPMLIIGFPPGPHGRDLSRPIVRPMTASESLVARANAPSWRGGPVQPNLPPYPSGLRSVTEDGVEACAEIAQGDGDRIWCVVDDCEGSTERYRANGPDGPRTLCLKCSGRYAVNALRLFESNGAVSVFPRHGWTVHTGEAGHGTGGLWWKLDGDVVVCWCARCGAVGGGWCGPDGTGSLCHDCWTAFKEGGMVMALTGTGKASLVTQEGGRRCLVRAWRGVERGRVDYRNPVVEEYYGALQVGEVMELEEEEQEQEVEAEGVQKEEETEEEALCFHEKEDVEDLVGKQEMEIEPGDVVEEMSAHAIGAGDVVVQEAEMDMGDEEDAVVPGNEEVIEGVESDEIESNVTDYQQEERLAVEVESHGVRRSGWIQVGLSFPGFCKAVRRLGAVQDREIEVLYRDDEGDFVTVGTEGDLIEMVHLARHLQLTPLLLKVERRKLPQRMRVVSRLSGGWAMDPATASGGSVIE